MKDVLSKLPLSKLIPDGQIHNINIEGGVLCYRLLLDPIVTFSYGVISDDNTIHWYGTVEFKSKIEWLNHLRNVIREPLVEKRILSRKEKLRNINRLSKINERIGQGSNV